jgi:hypothetical protein
MHEPDGPRQSWRRPLGRSRAGHRGVGPRALALASLLHNDAAAGTPSANPGRKQPRGRTSWFARHDSVHFLDLKLTANRRNIQNIDAAPRLPPSAPEAIMPDTRYYIVRHDRIWLIKFEDEEYGPYETQDEALRLASDAAEQLERHGESVEVHLVGL